MGRRVKAGMGGGRSGPDCTQDITWIEWAVHDSLDADSYMAISDLRESVGRHGHGRRSPEAVWEAAVSLHARGLADIRKAACRRAAVDAQAGGTAAVDVNSLTGLERAVHECLTGEYESFGAVLGRVQASGRAKSTLADIWGAAFWLEEAGLAETRQTGCRRLFGGAWMREPERAEPYADGPPQNGAAPYRHARMDGEMDRFAVGAIGVSPLEADILHKIYFGHSSLTAEEIIGSVEGFCHTTGNDVMDALVNGLTRGMKYVDMQGFVTPDGGIETRYGLSRKAHDDYFGLVGRGGFGSDSTARAVNMLAAKMMRLGNHCRPFRGRGGQPDMVVARPEAVMEDGLRRRSMTRWDEKAVLAISVGGDPSRNVKRAFAEWQSGRSSRCHMWHVVFGQEQREELAGGLAARGVPDDQYHVTVLDIEAVLNGRHTILDIPVWGTSVGLAYGAGAKAASGR